MCREVHRKSRWETHECYKREIRIENFARNAALSATPQTNRCTLVITTSLFISRLYLRHLLHLEFICGWEQSFSLKQRKCDSCDLSTAKPMQGHAHPVFRLDAKTWLGKNRRGRIMANCTSRDRPRSCRRGLQHLFEPLD